MTEIWKPIECFNGCYEVSNLGRVKSLLRLGEYCREDGYILRTNIKGNHYLSVTILKKRYLIHRFVAEAFIPNPDNLPQVNHKNLIKYDNRVENLEWVTASENLKHYNYQGFERPHLAERKKRQRPMWISPSLKDVDRASSVRQDYESGQKDILLLSKRYKCAQRVILKILFGSEWKNYIHQQFYKTFFNGSH